MTTLVKHQPEIKHRNLSDIFLHELENKLSNSSQQIFIDSVNYPVIIKQNGNCMLNNYAMREFGYSNFEINELGWDKIIQLEKNKGNEGNQTYNVIITKKNNKKYVYSSAKLVYNEIEIWLLFKENEKTILDENVNDSNKVLSIMYENTSDIMALIGTENNCFNVLSINQTFATTLRITKEKSVGKIVEEVFPNNSVKPLLIGLRWVYKNHKKINREISIQLNKSDYYFESTLIPIMNKNGECLFILLIAHDISERRRKEEELIKAKNEAEESNRLKATLLANMSHEVRTPLTGILGFAELLEEEIKNEDHLHLIKNIRTSGKRLLTTLNSIMELSRLESEKIQVYNTVLDIPGTMNQLAKRFKSEAESKGLTFETVINTNKLSLHLDTSLFTQIMINLIDNAIKFTKHGKVSISANETFEFGKPYVTFNVTDTGIGISKNSLKTIFKEFKQESEGWGRSHEGMGLGLSLVKRMTELMGGTVEVVSEKHKGSTFSVKFPAYYETSLITNSFQDNDIPIETSNPSKNKIPSVLVVEDNELNGIVIKLYLKNYFEVKVVTNAIDALQFVRANSFDVILMDINLGEGMNGIDTLNEIRKLPQYVKTPIIALTGFTFNVDRKYLLENGFNNYLAKPFDKTSLLNIINDSIPQNSTKN